MPDITPGQIAHAAFVAAEYGGPVPPARVATRWRCLLPSEQRGWEAAAQAVLVETLAHWRAREAAVLPQVQAVLRAWHVRSPGAELAEAMHALETWWAQQQETRHA